VQKLVVDGYNVIHADAELKRQAAASVEQARRALIGRIEAYLASRQVKITVVFDGAGGMVDADAVVPGRLQVLYSATGQSADDVIVSMLQRHTNPREFIVVTSDMADIGRAVRALGATVMPSAEFLARLEARKGESPGWNARVGEKPEPSDDDVDYWLRQFGDAGKKGPHSD